MDCLNTPVCEVVRDTCCGSWAFEKDQEVFMVSDSATDSGKH